MAPIYTRASRDFEFIPGMGSSLEIYEYNNVGVLSQNGTLLDIERGFIREKYTNKVTTHSGSNGATLRTRVGVDWTFALELSFPANILGAGLEDAFPQTFLGSMQSFGVQFNIGDPEFWTQRATPLPTRSYRATKALLSALETRLDSTGTEVIGLNIAAEGNSLLWTWVGTGERGAIDLGAPIHPGVWR